MILTNSPIAQCFIFAAMCFAVVKASISVTAELSGDKPDLLYVYSKVMFSASLNAIKLIELLLLRLSLLVWQGRRQASTDAEDNAYIRLPHKLAHS